LGLSVFRCLKKEEKRKFFRISRDFEIA